MPLSDDFRKYDPSQPLESYLGLTSLFGLAFLALWAIEKPREPASRAEKAVLLAVATHKLTRIVSRDRVLAPFRAPFTKFEKSAGAGEVEEETRGTGFQNAVGRLITCPYCLAPWIAVALRALFRAAPTLARLLTEILAIVTASDVLNQLYAKLEE